MTRFTNKRYSGVWLPVMLALITVSLVCDVKRAAARDNVIPDDLKIEQTYRPGPGQSVGSVGLVQGKAVIRHEQEPSGYLVSNGMRLYNGDTLYTAGDGHLELTLNDGSNLVLSSDTQITIDKSIYDPGSQSRLSFFNMVSGKARFMVKKMSDYKHSQFNVKTESSVVGVRGSDFIIEISQDGNKIIITANGNTILEIFDPANPLQEPVIVTSFQQLVTVLGEIMGQPVDLSEEEVMRLLEALGLLLLGDGGQGAGGPGGGFGGGPGGGFIPHGGTLQYLMGSPFGQSFFFGPGHPLLLPIFGPGPDNPNNYNPDNEMKPPLILPLPDLPGHP